MAKKEKLLFEDRTITNEDLGADPEYYGYVSRNGAWLIMKYSASAGTYLYATKNQGYSSAWAGRTGLSYTSPNNL